MAGFRDLLRVERTGEYDKDGRPVWQLLHPLKFDSAVWGRIEVPTGFKTNYASVPRAPFTFWLYGDRCWEEPALHDFAYTVRRMTREEADDLFLEALLLNPTISEGMANTMHKAVRWFGGSSWDDETNIAQPDYIRALIKPA